MARIEGIITDQTERHLCEAIMTTVGESKELSEAFDKLTDDEKDVLYSRVEEAVSEFFNNCSLIIEDQ